MMNPSKHQIQGERKKKEKGLKSEAKKNQKPKVGHKKPKVSHKGAKEQIMFQSPH
jgi:hypothetical protein